MNGTPRKGGPTSAASPKRPQLQLFGLHVTVVSVVSLAVSACRSCPADLQKAMFVTLYAAAY